MEEDAHKSPLHMAAVVLLLAMACMFFPTKYLSYIGLSELMAGALVRIVFGIVGIFFIFFFTFQNNLRLGFNFVRYIAVFIAALAVAVNNFPFIALLNGEAGFAAGTGKTLQYVLFCFSVGFFEEIYFRGLILPLLIVFFKDKKAGTFWAVAVSSAVFGLVHLVNLFGGAGFGSVMLQIGYSSLIGAMCAIVYVFSRSIWPAIFLHSVYDIGGLLLSYNMLTEKSEIWNTPTIILTAVLGVIAAAFLIIFFVKKYNRTMSCREVFANN